MSGSTRREFLAGPTGLMAVGQAASRAAASDHRKQCTISKCRRESRPESKAARNILRQTFSKQQLSKGCLDDGYSIGGQPGEAL